VSAGTVGDRWGRDSDELPIVLTGGPADGHWYRRDDFTQRQTAARRMAAIHHRSPLDPASWPLLYKPTATITSHRRAPTRQAVQWRWTGPAGSRNLHDLGHRAGLADAGEANAQTVA